MSRTVATEPQGVEDAGAGDGREGDLASLTRRPRFPAVLGRARCSGATTLSSRSSETHTGARGASYAGFTFAAVAVPRVEHLLAQEPALLLLTILGGALPAVGVFLEETGTGGEPRAALLGRLAAGAKNWLLLRQLIPRPRWWRPPCSSSSSSGTHRRTPRRPRTLGAASAESAGSRGGGERVRELQGRRRARSPRDPGAAVTSYKGAAAPAGMAGEAAAVAGAGAR